jgi:hypothetical protein
MGIESYVVWVSCVYSTTFFHQSIDLLAPLCVNFVDISPQGGGKIENTTVFQLFTINFNQNN